MAQSEFSQSLSLHCLAKVDILVTGGSSGGVAAALAAKAAGASVFVLSPRSYLGCDICDSFRLWLEKGEATEDELARETLQPRDGAPPSPLRVKATLEERLRQAGVPFLLNAPAFDVLLDEGGRVCGAVCATRSGPAAIAAKAVIDTSPRALLGEAAGADFELYDPGGHRFFRTVVGGEPRKAERAIRGVRAHPLPAALVEKGGERSSWQAYEYCLELEMDGASPSSFARAEAEARGLTWQPGQARASDFLYQVAPDPLKRGENHVAVWDGPDRFDLEALRANGQPLLLLSTRGDTDRKVAQAMDRPAASMAVGRCLGKWVVDQIGKAAGGEPEQGEARPANAGAEALPSGRLRLLDDWLPRGEEAGLARIAVDLENCPRLAAVDTLVVGGGTAGASAGIASARQGAKTLVCEALANLGGVGTEGQIAKYYFGNRCGFTREIDRGTLQQLADEEMDLAKMDRAGWNVEAKMSWYLKALVEAGGEAWFGSLAVGVWRKGHRVKGVLVSTPFGYGLIEAKAVIDATGNSDVATAAGAETKSIDARSVAVQGAGLSPRSPGYGYRNTDWTFIDDTDAIDGAHAFALARQKFKGEYDVAQLLDTRERRQIIGDFTLSPLDFLAGRTYPDTIVTASSNFDTHGFTIHPLFMLKPPDKKALFAHVPLRCLLPKGLDALLVTGLGISAHRDAIPLVRMQPDVQNQGYAAGVAAAWSALRDVPLRQLDARELQAHLVEQGILGREALEQEDSFPLAEERIEKAVREEIDTFMGLAIVFAHEDLSAPLMARLLETEGDASRRLAYAKALGLMGRPEGKDVLLEHVRQSAWDEGWDYRGMGQFGLSLSPLDSAIIALARAAGEEAMDTIMEKMDTLETGSAFSHFRAVGEACETIGSERLAPALKRLLELPGMQGHFHDSFEKAASYLSDNPNETETRNKALKEIHLARALYRCGDDEGLGERILGSYAMDLRGTFARHARAVLAEGPSEKAESSGVASMGESVAVRR